LYRFGVRFYAQAEGNFFDPNLKLGL
jgi:hypothetical protein